MLEIDKNELNQKFRDKDWNYVFDVAYRISDYLLYQQYRIFDDELRADMAQECCLNLLKKVRQNKVDENKNIFSFIWKNSSYRILEILRKERHRKEIATFVSYDCMLENFLGENTEEAEAACGE